MKVRKAIIPAAGLGTRFLPATKSLPKEMLPIVDKPTIQFIVEELLDSGIEDIVIVTGRNKRAIEDHFDKSCELEDSLERTAKFDRLAEVRQISEMVNIYYVRQKEPLGLGHAISCARTFIGDEPFAVLLGDDIVRSQRPCLKQLLDVYDKYGMSVVGVQEVAACDVSKYGIIEPSGKWEERVFPLATLVEKPQADQAPSNMAIKGRYVLSPAIFDILEHLTPGSGGEIQLTDALKRLNEVDSLLAYCFEGTHYDIGDKFGFIKATIDFALERNDLHDDVLHYLGEVYETCRNFERREVKQGC